LLRKWEIWTLGLQGRIDPDHLEARGNTKGVTTLLRAILTNAVVLLGQDRKPVSVLLGRTDMLSLDMAQYPLCERTLLLLLEV
jgi:hypothetical protein